ncbi:MAG: site-2 protease family protein [Firmicutes bacterium]|nr:site-2 protease family protein [Bacillota bacterium]
MVSSEQLSGVVGIVVQGGQFVGADVLKALYFSILLSLNLAVFNLLPIPALDGGKIILYLLEKAHPKLLRLHIPLAVAGWVLLIGLMVYATVLDIGRIVS